MASTVLFEDGSHKNVLLEDFSEGLSVQSNQHLVVHGDEAMILDPGGHKVYPKVMSETGSMLGNAKLRYLFLSHQDPDIVAACNGWLMTTDAEAFVSELWQRFVPHFGLDKLVEDRLKTIPDEGMTLNMAGVPLSLIPAHFLHSAGNFQVYDPISKVLYSGDLGASIGQGYVEVSDFEAHLQYMEGFHRRYMACQAAMAAWSRMVRDLEIEVIAPQHGAIFRGKQMVSRFIDWAEGFPCGVDVMADAFKIPGS